MADLPSPEIPAGEPLRETPEARPESRGIPRWVWLTAASIIIGLSAIAMLGYLGFQMGPLAFGVGLTAALLPVPILLAGFLWLDRYEPEPWQLLVACFFWGAFPATLTALFVNTCASGAKLPFIDILVKNPTCPIELPDTIVGTVVAPVIEELMKALGPLAILWFRRRQIAGLTDGIVYCGLSGLGFAMVENILYMGGHGFFAGNEQYGPASGAQMVFGMFIGRILMSGFAHPLFTAMTGVGIGIAARSAQKWVRWVAPLCGMIVAMMLHGAWNLMATLSASISPMFFLYGYLAVMVPIFLTFVGVAIWVRAREGSLPLRILPRYAEAGWLTPPEVVALGTMGRRHAARVWAKRVAGEMGHRSMADFQIAATKLAIVRDSIDRGLGTHTQSEERKHLETMTQCRYAFVGRDAQIPYAVWDGRDYQILFPDGVMRRVPPPAEPTVPLPVVVQPPPPPPMWPSPIYGQRPW